MNDLAQSAQKVADLMRLLTTTGGLRVKFRITAGAGAADPDGLEQRDIYVECKGPDADLLVEQEGELLRSLEHIAAKILRLEPEEHDRVSFDANAFKATRARSLREAAERAIDTVDDTDEPYHFPPMNSRERRMLHLFLHDSGLQTQSSGEGPRRHLVVYPEGYEIPSEDRSQGGFDRSRGRGGPNPGGSRGRNRGGRNRY